MPWADGSRTIWPPLTSIRQRLLRAGAQAVQLIDALLTGADEQPGHRAASATQLQPDLIIRASTCAG